MTVTSVKAILLSPSVARPPPSAPEWLSETVVPVIVIEPRSPTLSGSPSVATPPPDACATLREMSPPVMTSVPPAEKTPPPFASVTLSSTSVFSSVSVPEPAFLTPAPSWSDVLRATSESLILIVPMLSNSA